MCGRYTLKTDGHELAEVFDLEELPMVVPRYNVAPTDVMPVIRIDEGQRRVMRARWGLVPFWAKTPRIGAKMINARSETASTKGAFKHAMRKRRCLVPVDGWYEWKNTEKAKHPFRFHRPDERPFAVAGLYEHWTDPESGEVLDSFTVLTTEPNAVAAMAHDRMPVLLHPDDWDQWLDPSQKDAGLLQQLLLPWAHDDLVATPVPKAVGNVRNDDESLIIRVEPEPVQGTLF